MNFNEDICKQFCKGSLLPKIASKEINLTVQKIPLEVINRVNERMINSIEANRNREIHTYNTNCELSKTLIKNFH